MAAMDEEAMVDRLAQLCAHVGPADSERLDPPAELWERIQTAVSASPSGSTDREVSTGAGTVVEYSIDELDVLVSVGAEWTSFARANEADELADRGTGTTLWDAIGDESLRDLWRRAVTTVRTDRRRSTFTFRCDGPRNRRWYEMTLTPSDDGSVHFRSELLFEMDRPDLRLLHRDIERDLHAATVALCSWCGRADDGGAWVPIEVLLARTRLLEADPPPPVRHGICPSCVSEMRAVAVT